MFRDHIVQKNRTFLVFISCKIHAVEFGKLKSSNETLPYYQRDLISTLKNKLRNNNQIL